MMDPQNFSSMELSAIAEVLNISLGSSATAVSNMLNRRVDITTPTVHVLPAEEFELGSVDPAVGVEITYVSGLSGQNIMLLRRQDVRAVVDILMDRETPDEEFVLDELSMSAICEVMNQMMGASATALSEFLGRMVNISTPTAFEVKNVEQFRRDYFPAGRVMVVISFVLSIEGAMQSEFMNVMTCDLARELIGALGLPSGEDTPAPAPEPEPSPAPAASAGGTLSQEEIERLMAGAAAPAPEPEPSPAPAASAGGTLSQEEIERLMAGAAAPASQPAPSPAPAASAGGTLSQEEIERLMAGAAAPASGPAPSAAAQPVSMPPAMQQPAASAQTPPDAALLNQLTQLIAVQQQQIQMQQQAQAQIQNKVIQTDAPLMPSFANGEPLGEEQAQNLDLIMSVPLEVSVEIGRTRRVVKDILGFTKGSLVVLDTLAGDQVNLFVNGQCIARGDVVVVEDNFGIRITEILQRPDLGALTKPYR